MVTTLRHERAHTASQSTERPAEGDASDLPSPSPYRRAAIWLLLAALCALVIAGTVALTHGIPDRDSGEFLYVAQQVLNGHIPYRDTWDHKPPAIFYIDAVALLSGQGLRALWTLEWLSLSLASILGFEALRRSYGTLPSVAASVLWPLAALPLLQGGNFTEEYALLFLCGALWAFSHVRHARRPLAWSAGMGALCALAMLCKPTAAGIFIAMLLYLGARIVVSGERRFACAACAATAGGFLTPLVLTAAYFASQHALAALVDAVIVYNRIYARSTALNQISATIDCFSFLALTGIAPTVLLAWWHGAARLVSAVRRRGAARLRLAPLTAIAVMALPIDALLAVADGRAYLHYYLLLLPASSILMAHGLHALQASPASPRRWVKIVVPLGSLWLIAALLLAAIGRGRIATAAVLLPSGILVITAAVLAGALAQRRDAIGRLAHRIVQDERWLALLVLPLALSGYAGILAQTRALTIPPTIFDPQPVVAYIQAHTTPRDGVLVWGDDSYYLFASNRAAPARYAYQYPLYMKGYTNSRIVGAFVRDVRARPPRVVVESGDWCMLPLDSSAGAGWHLEQPCTIPPQIRRLGRYITTHYARQQVAGCDSASHCAVYLWKPSARSNRTVRQ